MEEEGEQVEEEEEKRGIEVSNPPKPQTCNKPQGLGSIFNSGKSSPAMPGSSTPRLLLSLPLHHHFASWTAQCFLLEPETTWRGWSTTPLVPCSPYTLRNSQQSECGLGV